MFPGSFQAPLFRTVFFHFPWDFEIAGFRSTENTCSMSLDTFLSNRKLKCMRFGWLPPGTLERIRLNQNGGRYIKGKVRARSETEQIGV